MTRTAEEVVKWAFQKVCLTQKNAIEGYNKKTLKSCLFSFEKYVAVGKNGTDPNEF